VFTSLTFGARGVLYFTYWDDPDGQHYGFGNSVITRRALPDTYNESDRTRGPYGNRDDYVKGPHWYHAKKINSMVLAFGKLLLTARSTKVFHLGGKPGSHPPPIPGSGSNLTECIVTSLEGAPDPTGLRGHFLIGQFVLEDGRAAVLLHNQDPARTQWATVTFARFLNTPTRNASRVTEVSPETATEAPLMDDSPLYPGLQMGFAPGMARFLVANSS
jgi:hypothetical protein